VLRRGQSNAVIAKAFADFRALGVETVSYNILGAPLETPDTLLATIRLNAAMRPGVLSAFLYYPFPGTESRRICEEHGFLTDRHGRHNGDVVMIHQPTLSDEDVLFTHRFFRFLVRAHTAIDALPAPLAKPAAAAFSAAFRSRLLPRRALLRLKTAVGSARRALLRPRDGIEVQSAPCTFSPDAAHDRTHPRSLRDPLPAGSGRHGSGLPGQG